MARALTAAVLAALLASSAPASADEQADVARAQALFTDGRTALEKGDYTTACARFNESLAVMKRASTLLNLGECEAKLGKLVSSSQHWKAGIALLPPGDERLAVSRERAAVVDARLPHLTVTISGAAPAGARIEVDGAAVPAGDLAAGISIDPGRHTVVLQVPGSPEQRSSIELVERESKTVTLTVEGGATTTPKPPSGGGGGSAGSGARTAGFALLGVGVIGGVVAGVTGGLLISRNAAINDACPVMGGTHVCTPHGRDLINGTAPLNVVNGVGWGVGLAGVAAGVVLVVVGGKTPAAVAPTALPGGGGVRVTARF